jgi:AraC-like DNA-binding protein
VSILLHAEDEPVATRVDYWRHVVETTIAPLSLRVAEGPDFRSRIHAGEVGPVQVTEFVVPGAELARSAKLVRQLDPDLCKIDVQVAGHMVVEQHERQASLRAGDFALVDLSRPCRWTNTPGQIVAVTFPRSLLPLPPDEITRIAGVRICGGGGIAGLVSSLAGQLVAHIGRDGADGTRLGAALLDLLTVALAEPMDRTRDVPPDARRRALLLRVQAFIEQRLGDPTLTPQSIADAHHVSVRSLYSLFEMQGETVAAWIRRRRLAQCRRELLDPASDTQLVGAIGARWGFTSPDHFSRAFRAAFGASPREFRSRPR